MLDLAQKLVETRVLCDHCLGRQFAQLSTGTTDAERGKAIRHTLAMMYDAKPFPIKLANFAGVRLRKTGPQQPERCEVCLDLFARLPAYAEKVAEKLRGLEYNTFVVGTHVSADLVKREESVWELIGTEHCEPLKAEINRELGKLISLTTGKEGEEKTPDITITLDLEKKQLDVRITPLYIYGEYQKLIRGIPQSKWEKYKDSVEDIMARPFIKATHGIGHAIHAVGREDIDARCLGRRPFVLEIKNPRKRTLDLAKLAAQVGKSKKIKIHHLRPSSVREAVYLKTIRPEKSYRASVRFETPLTKAQQQRLKNLEGLVRQKTPTRVLHRRSDKLRRRKVLRISWTGKSRDFTFTVRGEAGLYIKELFSGDNGRTKPSAADLTGVPVTVKTLDVIAVHMDTVPKMSDQKPKAEKPSQRKPRTAKLKTEN